MKTVKRIVLAFLLIAICCSAFSLFCLAEGLDALTTRPIEEPEFDISSIIRDLVTEERVSEWYYRIIRTEKPEAYRYDPSVYLLEYGVSKTYWSRLSEMSYDGMVEEMIDTDKQHPTIYIPMFGDVPNSEGVLESRFIGYIYLKYHPWSKYDHKYNFNMTLYSIESDNFKNKENIWYYDEIESYLLENKVAAEQVLLIQNARSLRASEGRIAVIKTENDTVILDVANTLQLDSSKDSSIAYTVEEYRTLRLEVEKELYQTENSGGNIQAGGNGGAGGNTIGNTSQGSTVGWVTGILCSVIAIGVGTLMLVKSLRATARKE